LHATDDWAAFRGLDAAHTNIFAAYEHGLADPSLRSLAVASLQHARWALWVRGYWRMLLQLFEVAERQLEEPELGADRPCLLRMAGDAAAERGQLDLAEARMEKATEEFLANDEPLAAADAQQGASAICARARNWEGAIAHILREIEIIGEEDVKCRNIAMAGLAHAYLEKGDYGLAVRLYEGLKTFWQGQPDSDGHLAMIARGHSACLAATGQPEAAAELLVGSVETFRRMGLFQWEMRGWQELAGLYALIGDTAKAEAAEQAYANLTGH